MTPLTSKELLFVGLAAAVASLFSWLSVLSFSTVISVTVVAVVAAVTGVVLARLAIDGVLEFAAVSTAGALGLLSGATLEFGKMGLWSLSSICISVSKGGGFDVAWRMFVLSPVAHLGMCLGCSVGLFVFCQFGWRGHVYCVIGMVIGMIASAAFHFPLSFVPLEFTTTISVVWMWLCMCFGMLLPHGWFSLSSRSSCSAT